MMGKVLGLNYNYVKVISEIRDLSLLLLTSC